jgi:hypothetical protein
VRLAGFVSLALCAFILGLSNPARAQSTNTNTNTNTLTPISSPNGVISMIPNAQGIERKFDYYSIARPWWISYSDCIGNAQGGDEWTFSITVRDTDNPLEIWAGSENCAINRSRTDRGQCWIVASQAQLSDTVNITVPVRNVVARRLDTTNPPTNVGTDVCDDSTDPSGEALTLYFMIVDSGQADEYFAWDATNNGGVGFDVVGPDPPSRINVGIGESQLSIGIDGVREETDRDRFEAFCVPAGTTRESIGLGEPTPGIVDAGGSFAITDAGLDGGLDGGGAPLTPTPTPTGTDAGGGGAAPAACFTDVLVAGQRPPVGFSCGTVSETARSLNTSRLLNGTTYAVALAGQDNIGNAGVASDIQCGTPIPLDDFFELYSRNGGPGGGGFCSFSPAGSSSQHYGAGLLGLLLAGFAVRRVRGRS